MYRYSNRELFRKCFLLFLHSFRSGTVSTLGALAFIFRYGYHTFFSDGQKILKIDTRPFGRLYLRTKSSDLEVFFQHFIYQELVHPNITSLQGIHSVLDLGANIGYATVVLANLFPGARIIAVEMEEENFNMLKINCEALIQQGRVEPLLGAFYHKKEAVLGISRGHLGEWHFSAIESEEVEGKIPIHTIDDISDKLAGRLPDLTKMDIEGGEAGFLADDDWCEKMFGGTNLLVELHHFEAFSLYFQQVKKNGITMASRVGEYWMTLKS